MYSELVDGCIYIYESFMFRESIKEIEGKKWIADYKAWSIPLSNENLMLLNLIGCEFSGELKKMFLNIRVIGNECSIPAEPIEPMPLKVKPYKHQIQAFNFAGKQLGIFKRGDANEHFQK